MVMREGATLCAAGLGLGFLIAIGAGYLVRSMLIGVSGADPLSFGVAFLTLGAATILATYFPARRAAGVEPMTALRCD
jgi:ABC-type antimicrobial peptide transport system permease subunit